MSLRTLESKKHSVKSAAQRGTGLASTEFGCTKFYSLANGIALASIVFGCTHRNTLVRGISPAGSVSASACGRGVHRTPAPPKTPKRKDGNYRKKNRENQVLVDR